MMGEGDWSEKHRGRSRSHNCYCGRTATLHYCQSQCLLCEEKKRGGEKIEEEPWECSAVDLPFKKVWGDNKYPNDSSVPLHPN